MRKFLAVPVVLATAAILLAGCAGGGSDSAPTGGATAGSSSNPFGVTKDAALAKTLPTSVASSGALTIGVDPTYAPNEYKDSNGNIIGWDVDLGNAIAALLGVKATWTQSTFDNIIPSITGGRYDLGISSFADTTAREQQTDFVSYYNAGALWASAKGHDVDPNNACGLRVGAETGTTQALQQLPATSKACVAAGKKPIQILTYNGQDLVTNALVLGQVDAMTAAAPIVEYAVHEVPDKLQTDGEMFDIVPYGIALAKDSKLTEVIKNAVQRLIDDGAYMKILKKWGVESGAIKTAEINGASKQQ